MIEKDISEFNSTGWELLTSWESRTACIDYLKALCLLFPCRYYAMIKDKNRYLAYSKPF